MLAPRGNQKKPAPNLHHLPGAREAGGQQQEHDANLPRPSRQDGGQKEIVTQRIPFCVCRSLSSPETAISRDCLPRNRVKHQKRKTLFARASIRTTNTPLETGHQGEGPRNGLLQSDARSARPRVRRQSSDNPIPWEFPNSPFPPSRPYTKESTSKRSADGVRTQSSSSSEACRGDSLACPAQKRNRTQTRLARTMVEDNGMTSLRKQVTIKNTTTHIHRHGNAHLTTRRTSNHTQTQ